MKKIHFLFILVVFLLIGVAAAWVGKSTWDYLTAAPNPRIGQPKSFIIYKGQSTTQIAENLQKEGLVRSATAFRLLAKITDKAGSIQAGSFKLSPSMSTEEILQELGVGAVDKWVTLLEGWRVEEMAERLNQDLGIKQEEFLARAKEGYMFPDTYLFSKDGGTNIVVKTMQDNFNEKYDSTLQQKIRNLGLTPNEGVILASIVEREGRSEGVKQAIASILLKRLNIGMALNADATVQYALGYKPADGWWKRHLTREDLKVESPYNTYLYAGLPPGPISNPGLVSLRAVANADPSTPYLYYYHDSEGISHYGRTLEEHNQNVASYP